METLTSAPYEYEFSAAIGDYTLSAKVTDSNGSSFVTDEVIVTVVEEMPASVDENSAAPAWKQTEDLVTVENAEVKEMWLFSVSGALIAKTEGQNSIKTMSIPNGERFVVVAKIAGRSNVISNKFIK